MDFLLIGFYIFSTSSASSSPRYMGGDVPNKYRSGLSSSVVINVNHASKTSGDLMRNVVLKHGDAIHQLKLSPHGTVVEKKGFHFSAKNTLDWER